MNVDIRGNYDRFKGFLPLFYCVHVEEEYEAII